MRHFQRSDFRGGLRAQMSEAEMREMEHLNRSYLHLCFGERLEFLPSFCDGCNAM